MKKLCCALLALSMLLSASALGAEAIAGSAGEQVVTPDMARLYRLQSLVSKQILEGYGYAEYAAAVVVPDESQALDELLTVAAVAQLALSDGAQPDAARAEKLVRSELFDVSATEGMEYLADYARGIIDGFGGDEAGLLDTAVALKSLTLLAEDYVQALARADQDKSVSTMLKELNARLASVPLSRDDGAPATLSQLWLENTVFLFAHYE